MKTKVAVLGGTFDPIHLGHLGIAQEITAKGIVDKVLFLPASTPPHKLDKQISPSEIRVEMIESTLSSDMELCRYEIDNGQRTSYSEQTMQVLKTLYPDYDLFFFMGMDSLNTLHLWRNFTAFIEDNDFIVYTRQGDQVLSLAELTNHFSGRHDLAEKMLSKVVFLPDFPISSTQVRIAVQKKQSFSHLVSQTVEQIITREKLYTP